MTDFDEEEYYARNAIEGSARLRAAILRQQKAPTSIVWIEPEEYEPISRRSISSVQAEVAGYFHINPQDMGGHSRLRAAAHPRQIAMYFARKMIGAPFPKIAREFGGRDHTTVMYAVKAVEKRMAADPACRADVEVLRERLAA